MLSQQWIPAEALVSGCAGLLGSFMSGFRTLKGLQWYLLMGMGIVTL